MAKPTSNGMSFTITTKRKGKKTITTIETEPFTGISFDEVCKLRKSGDLQKYLDKLSKKLK